MVQKTKYAQCCATALVMIALLVVVACAGAGVNDNSADRGDSDRRYRAAERLLLLFDMDMLMNQMTDQLLDAQFKQNPGLMPYKDVMMAFFSKYLAWESIKNDMIQIYINEFTESELNEMIAFYQTPTGRKVIEKLPNIMKKGGEIGLKRVQENQQELNRMIEEKSRKLKQAGKKPASVRVKDSTPHSNICREHQGRAGVPLQRAEDWLPFAAGACA